MSTQQSNERKQNRPLSHIPLHARQLLRDNAQRAVNWFRKPSFPRFKLKVSSPSSPSSPYSHPSSTDNASIQTSSSATVYSVRSTRPRATQTRSTYNTRRLVRTSAVIVPVMPTVSLLLFTVHEADPYVSSSVLALVLYHLINVNIGHGILYHCTSQSLLEICLDLFNIYNLQHTHGSFLYFHML